MKTILVTGGSGYIGSVVCRLLYEAGNKVINIDIIERDQLGITQYVTNVNSHLTNEAIKEHKPDAIIHLAADHSVPKSLNDPAGTYSNNLSNTLQLLNSATEHNVKHFVFSSSSSVYGSAGTIDEVGMIPFVETQQIDPVTPYSRSKAMIETILKDYGRAYGMTHMSLRYFNAAGSHKGELGYRINPAEHLIPILVDCAYTGKEFKLNGDNYNTPDGTCIRDYTHVTDIAKAHIAAVDYLIDGNESTVLNLGSNNPQSIRQVIEQIEYQSDKYIYTVSGSKREGDMEYTFADITKANRILHWSPSHTFADIISDDIKWYIQTHNH